ncbi:MAG TPA: poly(R)-hydroxyalkanoic acid synthase subunit PhaE [Dehalococcoidales bacterium]|nr:poly(R)-hydroxyalkanoic acid synthase subunit PhaE [Dehalococcoidales bacterium]
MAEKRASENSKTSPDSGMQLHSESQEYLTRTIAMHDWLREAYWLLCQKHSLTSEELFETWRPAFERIYGNLFATFFRPYRMMMFPYGANLGNYASPFLFGAPNNPYFDFIRSLGQLQTQFFQGMATASASDRIVNNASPQASVSGANADYISPEEKAFLDTLEQSLNYFHENHFPLPNNYISNIKQLAANYPKSYRLALKHEGMFRSVWEKSLKLFTVEIKKTGSQVPEFREFYNTYMNIFSQEYSKLVGSSEYIKVQNDFLTTSLNVNNFFKKVIQGQIEMFPALPFTTEGEMTELEQTVHSHKRRINSLERKVREMERDAMAASGKPKDIKK